MTSIPEGTPCADCLRPATDTYATSVTDWAHGHYAYLCKYCLMLRQLGVAQTIINSLTGQVEALRDAYPPVEK